MSATLEKEINEFVAVTIQLRELESVRVELAKKVLQDMSALGIQNVPIYAHDNHYRVERVKSVSYEEPTPEQVRKAIGEKMASDYIKEYVIPELRTSLPPNLADKLYPIKKQSEFVRVIAAKE
jgi:hypothetical protein